MSFIALSKCQESSSDVAISSSQTKNENTGCANDAKIDKLVTALASLGDIIQYKQEVEVLQKRLNKMAKALKKLKLFEDLENELSDRTVDDEISTTTTTQRSTTTTTISTTTTDNGPCKDGWSYIGENCYIIITDTALTWDESRQQCMLQGGDLAEMNTVEEQTAMAEHINAWHYGIPLWLGGMQNKRGRWRWEWTETKIPMRAVKWGWAEGYPRSEKNNTSTQDTANCLAMRGRGEAASVHTWENMPCQQNNNFVCEYLWLQEYLDEQKQAKMTRKLEENLIKVDKIRQARLLQ